MEVDYLIIGQGICGTFLSYELLKAGKKIIVIDEPQNFTASKVASGIINPVTGRRIVKTWLIDELLPFAFKSYRAIEIALNTSLITECSVFDFHPSLQMKTTFLERMNEAAAYLHTTNESQWQQYFHFNYGIGEIKTCLLIDLQKLLFEWRKKLRKENILIEEKFNFSEFFINQSELISYKNIITKKIIFCEGIEAFQNPYFKMLPFVRTKGEALIAEIPDLPYQNIYKQGINIVPWKDGLFWIGSSYEWTYADTKPTELFKRKMEHQLNHWLKISYKIIDHLASERPANVERRPFVGLHPIHKTIGILNGMGTKGCSLAPYFASQLTSYLIKNIPINPLADVNRFEKILSKY